MKSHSKHSTAKVKSKVKSGCRTCKIRKVKCDEGRPICHRCISTGRTCDGYGIWGGGGNFYGNRQQPTVPELKDYRVAPRPFVSPSVFPFASEEIEYFDWFRCRTAIKLPGSFVSRFWNTLLLQASVNEAAVLHAVVALSAVHRRGVTNANSQRKNHDVMDEQEQSTLQHYMKAISHLQPHFSIKDGASFRIALITCIVFIYLEFLRGHFETAQVYLQNGLRILGDIKILSDGSDGILHVNPGLKSSDRWIVEAFSRLHLQVELFKHSYQHRCLVLQVCKPQNSAHDFQSINEAWQELEKLLNGVFCLKNQYRQQDAPVSKSVGSHCELQRRQQNILTDLSQWLDKYEAFFQALPHLNSTEEEKAYLLLYIYHTMANIMANTCIGPDDELAFDYLTSHFVLMIKQLVTIWKLSATTFLVQTSPGHLVDMSRSIVDIGWIPPLYYTAIKCRIHRIRIHAIRLLESSSHREGIWDANTAACVARKVMEIEERGFYQEFEICDDFLLSNSPQPRDLTLPTLPNHYRMREVEVVLSGAPMNKIQLYCTQRLEGTDNRLMSQYDVYQQKWIDGSRC